jgi:hypothetical protein
MGIFLLLGLAILFQIVFPQLANVLAWILTIGFIVPFFTFAGGSFVWATLNIFTLGSFFNGASWFSCCAFVGFPMGLMMAWYILAD